MRLTGGGLTVYGSSDAIALAASSSLNVYGANDVVSAGSRDWVYVDGADTVVGAANDTIYDAGQGLTYQIGVAAGHSSIVGFGADASAIVDLINGVGGYKSAAAAAAALTSDGHGGSLLSLGANGSIDLVGVAPHSIGAKHFAIGGFG